MSYHYVYHKVVQSCSLVDRISAGVRQRYGISNEARFLCEVLSHTVIPLSFAQLQN